MPDWVSLVLGIAAIAMSIMSLEMSRRIDVRNQELEEKIAVLDQLRKG